MARKGCWDGNLWDPNCDGQSQSLCYITPERMSDGLYHVYCPRSKYPKKTSRYKGAWKWAEKKVCARKSLKSARECLLREHRKHGKHWEA